MSSWSWFRVKIGTCTPQRESATPTACGGISAALPRRTDRGGNNSQCRIEIRKTPANITSPNKARFRAARSAAKFLLIGVCAVVAAAGCGKKVTRPGMPFDLDRVFTGIPSPKEESWKEKGVRLAKEKEYSKAIEAFMQHVVEEPESFFGFNAIAVCYKNLGDHSNAMKNFERAFEFTESSEERAKVLANIGNLYFSADKPQVALGYYKEASSEFPKDPLYLILVARTFVVLDDYERARKVLAAAEKTHKNLEKYERGEDKGLGSYLAAHCYLALNDESKVFQYLESALKANPARYVPRIEKDVADERNLLYTLKDDPLLKKTMAKYSASAERAPSPN